MRWPTGRGPPPQFPVRPLLSLYLYPLFYNLNILIISVFLWKERKGKKIKADWEMRRGMKDLLAPSLFHAEEGKKGTFTASPFRPSPIWRPFHWVILSSPLL